eukprot:353800-Chlamydomonas_euryale.AAC.3
MDAQRCRSFSTPKRVAGSQRSAPPPHCAGPGGDVSTSDAQKQAVAAVAGTTMSGAAAAHADCRFANKVDGSRNCSCVGTAYTKACYHTRNLHRSDGLAARFIPSVLLRSTRTHTHRHTLHGSSPCNSDSDSGAHVWSDHPDILIPSVLLCSTQAYPSWVRSL